VCLGRPGTAGGPSPTSKERHLPPSLDLALAAASAATEKQALDVTVLDVSQPLVITDYFIICSAANDRQVRAIAEAIEEACRDQGTRPAHREGVEAARWVLLDFTDVVVHIFLDEAREYYNLERIWQDAPVVARTTQTGDLVKV
jgi:ribosome-associated protein